MLAQADGTTAQYHASVSDGVHKHTPARCDMGVAGGLATGKLGGAPPPHRLLCSNVGQNALGRTNGLSGAESSLE
jgi:hypothetical protein